MAWSPSSCEGLEEGGARSVKECRVRRPPPALFLRPAFVLGVTCLLFLLFMCSLDSGYWGSLLVVRAQYLYGTLVSRDATGGGLDSLELAVPQGSLPDRLLDHGIVSTGDPARARAFAESAASGRPLRIAVMGGSVSYGRGASRIGVTDYVARVFSWLRATLPRAGHVMVNVAIPATTSEYMAACWRVSLPVDLDLVIVEYAMNDGIVPWRHPHRRCYERLLRHMLGAESAPLIVPLMLFNYAPHQCVWGLRLGGVALLSRAGWEERGSPRARLREGEGGCGGSMQRGSWRVGGPLAVREWRGIVAN